MRLSVFISALATSIVAVALPVVSPSNGTNTANCQDLSFSVPVTAQNIKFADVDHHYCNQSYISEQFLQLAVDAGKWTAAHVTNETVVNEKTYTIHARFCTPQKGGLDNSPLILAVHGINYDSRYWDFDFSPEYSLVQAATAKGYSIVIYDRLGTGQSEDTTDGFGEAQGSTEVEILAGIIKQLRAGTAIAGKQFSKIVGVGHSYGSAQVQSLTSTYPDLLDGAALTGFTTQSSSFSTVVLAGSFMPTRQVFPDRFPTKPCVFLSTGDDASYIEQFFWPPNYAQGAFDLARKYVDGATISAFATLQSILKPAPNFNKPVFVQTGERDITFCGLNCTESALTDVRENLYPMTSMTNFSHDFVLGTGHGIVAHYSGPESLQKILIWIDSNF